MDFIFFSIMSFLYSSCFCFCFRFRSRRISSSVIAAVGLSLCGTLLWLLGILRGSWHSVISTPTSMINGGNSERKIDARINLYLQLLPIYISVWLLKVPSVSSGFGLLFDFERWTGCSSLTAGFLIWQNSSVDDRLLARSFKRTSCFRELVEASLTLSEFGVEGFSFALWDLAALLILILSWISPPKHRRAFCRPRVIDN